MSKASQRGDEAARKFCEATYKPGEKKFVVPPERAVPGPSGDVIAAGTWRWVNLWATWCKPCIDELPLLDRWRTAMAKAGTPLGVELWSIDEEEEPLRAWLAKTEMPGQVRWLKSGEDLGPMMESFGIDKNSAIPVHVLVDKSDDIRCVRVGAVHEGDFGKIRAILSGG